MLSHFLLRTASLYMNGLFRSCTHMGSVTCWLWGKGGKQRPRKSTVAETDAFTPRDLIRTAQPWRCTETKRPLPYISIINRAFWSLKLGLQTLPSPSFSHTVQLTKSHSMALPWKHKAVRLTYKRVIFKQQQALKKKKFRHRAVA